MNKRQFKKQLNKTVINEELIPKQTPYCYSIDKNTLKQSKEITELPTILCPYYLLGKGNMRGCLVTGHYGDNLSLEDQIKICKY